MAPKMPKNLYWPMGKPGFNHGKHHERVVNGLPSGAPRSFHWVQHGSAALSIHGRLQVIVEVSFRPIPL